MRGSWTAGLGRFPLAVSRTASSHRDTSDKYADSSHTREKRRVDVGVRYMVHAAQGGPTAAWAERHVLRTLPPPGPMGDPSFFPLRSTAGPCRPSPCLHAQPNLVKARSSSFQSLSRLVRVLLPLHHQHSTGTAQHCTARRCAFAAPSPPMMLPLVSPSPLPLLPPPMLPVPVSPRALAPRGLGLSTRPSTYRRSNRVFYSRNPHCDRGLGQRSGHASQ